MTSSINCQTNRLSIHKMNYINKYAMNSLFPHSIFMLAFRFPWNGQCYYIQTHCHMSFGIDPRKLKKLIDLYHPNNHAEQLKYLIHLRGQEELYINLQTSPFQGISTNSIEDRKNAFGTNQVYIPLPSLPSIFIHAFGAPIIYIPFIVSISIFLLSFGDFLTEQRHGTFQGLFAISVAVCNWVLRCSDQLWLFWKRKTSKDEFPRQTCTVVRQNKRHEISSEQLVVGDVVEMKQGDRVGADGWLIQGFSLTMNQKYTLETNQIEKDSLKNCITDLKPQILQRPYGTINSPKSPVILSGSTVKSGQGRMIVLAVGKLSKRGQFYSLSQHKKGKNLIQQKIHLLEDTVIHYLLTASTVYVAAFFIEHILQCVLTQDWSQIIAQWEWENLLIGIWAVFIGIPQSLTLGIYIGLFLIKIRLWLSEQISIYFSRDITRMAVVSQDCESPHFKQWWNEQTINFRQEEEKQNLSKGNQLRTEQSYIDLEEMHDNFREILITGLKLKNTKQPGKQHQLSNQTILKKDIANEWSIFEEIIDEQSFTYICDNGLISYVTMTENKALKQENAELLFLKGTSEDILDKCSHMIHKSNGDVKFIETSTRTEIMDVVRSMNKRLNATYAIAYRVIDPIGPESQSSLENQIGSIQNKNMTFLCLLGVSGANDHDQYQFVQKLKEQGINILLVSSQGNQQSINRSKRMGINTADDESLSLQGHEFLRLISDVICRNCKKSICVCNSFEATLKNEQQFRRIIKYLKVMPSATYLHKYALMVGFNQISRYTAFMGRQLEDMPALAHSYLSIGTSQSDQADQNISAILPHISLKTLYCLVLWSRFSVDFIRKCIQLILPACIVPSVIMFISGLAFQQNPFSFGQILWVSVVLCSVSALNLSWQKPQKDSDTQKPQIFNKESNLITESMEKQIVSQCIFQIAILLVTMLFGHLYIPETHDSIDDLIGSNWQAKYSNSDMTTVASGLNHNPLIACPSYRSVFATYSIFSRHLTIVYNIYALMQIFNYLNCRRIKQKQINILEGIQPQNVIIFLTIIIGHFIFIHSYADAVDLYPQGLTIQQWSLSIGLAIIVWLVSFLARLLPKSIPNTDNSKYWENKSQNLGVKLVVKKQKLSKFQTEDDLEFKYQ